MELRRYWSLVKRWSWMILAITLLVATVSFVINSLTTPIYQASTTLLINQAPNNSASPDYNSLITSERLAKTYKELLRTRPVLQKVIDNLQLKLTEEQLTRNINVEIVRDTQLIVLSVEDSNPQQAALIANAIAKEFSSQNQNLQATRYTATKQSLQDELDKIQTDISRTQAALDALKTPNTPDQVAEQTRLQSLMAQYRNSYSSLLKSFEDVRLAEVQATSNLSVVEEAQTPKKPIRPNTVTSTILAIVVGLIFSIGIAFLIEYLDESVKTTEQVEQLIGASTLGVIARIKGSNFPDRLVTITQASSPAAEAYRVLRANIEFSEVDNPIRTIVICSSNSGEGKSMTASNLAIAVAQSGKQVILVDCDLRRPSLHKYFQQNNTRGVTTVLLEQSGGAADHLINTPVENLRLMASGPIPPNPAELLGSQRMVELIQELKTMVDVVIFDSSPILPVADPTLLARNCDASLIVVNSGYTRAGALKKAQNQLLQSGTRLLGVVLNKVSTAHSTYYYYYYNTYSSSPAQSRRHFPLLGGGKQRRNGNGNGHHPSSNGNGHHHNGNGNGHKQQSYQELMQTTQAVVANEPNYLDSTLAAVVTPPSQIVLGRLEVVAGGSAGEYFDISKERIIVGRKNNFVGISEQPGLLSTTASPTSNGGPLPAAQLTRFSVEDGRVSRQHIEILHTPDGVYLRDLNSMNGTWLNGKKVKTRLVKLEDRAEIRLGYQTTMIYRNGGWQGGE